MYGRGPSVLRTPRPMSARRPRTDRGASLADTTAITKRVRVLEGKFAVLEREATQLWVSRTQVLSSSVQSIRDGGLAADTSGPALFQLSSGTSSGSSTSGSAVCMTTSDDFCGYMAAVGLETPANRGPKPGQVDALRCTLAGLDVVLVAPCGGGKTLVLLAPGLHGAGVTVVLSPLRALIETQVAALNAMCGRVVAMHDLTSAPLGRFGDDEGKWQSASGGNDSGSAEAAPANSGCALSDEEASFPAGSMEAKMTTRDGLRFAYYTPEQLVEPKDPERRTKEVLGAIARRKRAIMQLMFDGLLERFVVDEAHTVAQWGSTWRERLARLGIDFLMPIRDCCPGLRPPPVLALTGTAGIRMTQDIADSLGLRAGWECVRVALDRPELRITGLDITHVGGKYRDVVQAGAAAAFALVPTAVGRGHGIVYVHLQADTATVRQFLHAQGCTAFAYHAGMDQEDRTCSMRSWQTTEGAWLVATLAASLGIDCPDVRVVVHLAFRKDVIDYWQEMCRGGRDGASARCIAVWHPLLLAPVGFHADLHSGSPAQAELLGMLRALVQRDGMCRRLALLPLLGEDVGKIKAPCGACDVCEPSDLGGPRARLTLRDLGNPARELLASLTAAQRKGRALPYKSTLQRGEWRKSLPHSAAYALISDLLCEDVVRLGHASSVPQAGGRTLRWATLEVNHMNAWALLRQDDPTLVYTHHN